MSTTIMVVPSCSILIPQHPQPESIEFFFDTVSWCIPPLAGLECRSWLWVAFPSRLIGIHWGCPTQPQPDPTIQHQIVWSRKAARCLINTIRAVLPHDNHVTVILIINKPCRCWMIKCLVMMFLMIWIQSVFNFQPLFQGKRYNS